MTKISFTAIVVEDEDLIAKNIVKNIQRANENFEVVAVSADGEDALRQVEKYMPNVVLTDIQMPLMNGLELVRIISEKYPLIRCIIISGHDDFAYAKDALKNHVADYLLKPINLDELTVTLRRIENDFLASQKELTSEFMKAGNNPEDIVQLMKEYIRKNYQDQINLTDMASSLGYSLSYLSKIFIKNTGLSPVRYIRDFRINAAKQLLRNPQIPINIIGKKIGYADPFHFSKMFKQAVGISPSEYRIQNGEHK